MVAVAATTLLFSFGLGAAAVDAAPGNGKDPHASNPGQTPSGSNGVNHNDPPPNADPNCTNSAGTSGTCSSPQPPSNADQNNVGANDTSSSNQYASTRNGAPSDNGNGNGQATGKPCAGCVGKADNKNPPGQAPNGPTDHNNGYECDGNNGIGQTNPAHTGCTGATSAPGTCDTSTSSCLPCESTTMNCVPCAGSTAKCAPCAPTATTSCTPGGQVSGQVSAAAGAASGTPAAEVLGVTISRSGEAASQTLPGELVRTGVDIAVPLGMGVVLLAGGIAIEELSRRKRSSAQAR
jgi:hypothetical protein